MLVNAFTIRWDHVNSSSPSSSTAIFSSEADLSPSTVLSAPPSKLVARRSVKFSESALVNWARPLRGGRAEQEAATADGIFGESTMRNRRVDRANLAPIPSPQSPFDAAPITPSLDTARRSAEHVPGERKPGKPAKGLGVAGVAEWDSPLSDYLDPSEADSVSTESSPEPSEHSDVTSASASFLSLSSPNTLDELRSLREAALALEREARSPFRESPAPVASQRMTKRKAVPIFDEAAAAVSSITLSRPASLLDPFAFPKHNHEAPLRQPFYRNAGLEGTAPEVSPRSVSLPLHSTPRTHRSDNSSSSSSWSEQPITPTLDKTAFIDHVEIGLLRLGQGMHEHQYEGKDVKVLGSKRGLSRLFGRVLEV